MTRLALVLTLALSLASCQSTGFQVVQRTLPTADSVVPLPVLCKKAKADADARQTALYNRYCAVQNANRLIYAREAYSKVRACYGNPDKSC